MTLSNSRFHSLLVWIAGCSSFPFTSLPIDLQWKTIDVLDMDDFISLEKSSKTMAACMDEQYSKKYIKSHLKSYLQPRDLFSKATCRSILALCGARATRKADRKACKVHVKAMKSMLCSGLSLGLSWQQTYLRFPLVALSPFKLHFYKYVSHFMSEASLCDTPIQDLHRAALNILEKTTEPCTSYDSKCNKSKRLSTAGSQPSPLKGESLCSHELVMVSQAEPKGHRSMPSGSGSEYFTCSIGRQRDSKLVNAKDCREWCHKGFETTKDPELLTMSLMYGIMQLKENQIVWNAKIAHLVAIVDRKYDRVRSDQKRLSFHIGSLTIWNMII